MTSRRGGRIPAQGRTPQAKGVGKSSKRHDLERPKTPGLHDSDLQQGDVQAMEAGQRIAPIKTQAPGQTKRTSQLPRDRTTRADGSGAPDPLTFLTDRLGGTLEPGATQGRPQTSTKAYLPLLERLATATGASGLLSQAFINQLANARTDAGVVRTPLISMQDVERDLADFLDNV